MNQRLKSPVREICTLGSVGAGGGRLPPATQWALSDERPYRIRNIDPGPYDNSGDAEAFGFHT